MKSLDELRQLVKSEISIDDLVSAVIFKSGKENMPKEKAFFQESFFQLKKDNPNLFSKLIFDESGISPFSDELDSVIFRLEASTILSTLNPTYRECMLTTRNKNYLQDSYNMFNLQQKKDIDKSASLFSKLIDSQDYPKKL